MTTSLIYPKPYVGIQIRPAIKDNDRSAEVVWTYLVARKYENNYHALVSKLLSPPLIKNYPVMPMRSDPDDAQLIGWRF